MENLRRAPSPDDVKLGNKVKAEASSEMRSRLRHAMSGETRPRLASRRASPEQWKSSTGGTEALLRAVQSAVPDFDGFKLGNEVKAEIHDVRRDRTKVNQSVSLSGTMEVEHQAAGHVAGSQTRPKSPVLAVAGLDAGWAVKTAENQAALAGVKGASREQWKSNV